MADSPHKATDTGVQVLSHDSGEVKQQMAVPDGSHQTSAVSRRAALSAYMTIAAAAFGLISDGCKCILLYPSHRISPDLSEF